MFRFSQRLSSILRDRKLDPVEQAALDTYDIELEDAISNAGSSVVTTTAVANYWEVVDSGTGWDRLQVDITETGDIDEAILYADVAKAAQVFVYDPGDGTDFAGISSGGVTITGYIAGTDIYGEEEINLLVGPGGNVIITVLPTSPAGLPSGALWNDSGTVKIV